MKSVLYFIWQWSWGILQSALGLIVFLFHIHAKHYFYHGAVVTEWKSVSSVSLGLFVFVTSEPFFFDHLVHEYGHTIQSLILGPLYLIVIGIPSTLWGFLPSLNNKRKTEGLSYFSFFTEKWANVLGEKVTGRKSMEGLVID